MSQQVLIGCLSITNNSAPRRQFHRNGGDVSRTVCRQCTDTYDLHTRLCGIEECAVFVHMDRTHIRQYDESIPLSLTSAKGFTVNKIKIDAVAIQSTSQGKRRVDRLLTADATMYG